MRVAAFQRSPTTNAASAAEALFDDLAWADAHDVDLAIFPECHLVGHAYDRPTIKARAVRLDGELIQGLLSRLRGVQATAVLGLFETRAGKILNTALVIAGGRIVGSYSKAHPNEEGVAPGGASPLFENRLPFGINICNDANHAAGAQRLAAAGARLICYPLCNVMRPEVAEAWRTRSVENLRQRALETGCWVVAADATGRQGDRLSFGCTIIVRPDGEIVERAAEMVETVILHDLD
jgi:predicted amidohydrolase